MPREELEYQTLTEHELAMLGSAMSEVQAIIRNACQQRNAKLPGWIDEVRQDNDRIFQILTSREKRSGWQVNK
jgi:hypothetical protein